MEVIRGVKRGEQFLVIFRNYRRIGQRQMTAPTPPTQRTMLEVHGRAPVNVSSQKYTAGHPHHQHQLDGMSTYNRHLETEFSEVIERLCTFLKLFAADYFFFHLSIQLRERCISFNCRNGLVMP